MVRVNVSHLTRLSVERRAAYLIAHYKATLGAAGQATFRPRLAQFVAHLAGVQFRAEASCYVGGHTFYATRNGGYQHVALYEGRRALALCRKLAVVGDRGVLDQPSGEARAEKRLLLTLADPGSDESLWTRLENPALALARERLQDPVDADPITEQAARLALPEPVAYVPIHLLRDRGALSLGETIASYLVAQGLSQSEAAESLGMGGAAEIRILLRRARLKNQSASAITAGPQFQAGIAGRIPESENVSKFGASG